MSFDDFRFDGIVNRFEVIATRHNMLYVAMIMQLVRYVPQGLVPFVPSNLFTFEVYM